MSPRFAVFDGVDVGNTNLPVGMASTGKSRLPTGFVV